MGWKVFLGFVFTLVVVFLLGVYWFLPFGETFEFEFVQKNQNFSLSSDLLGNEIVSMQFYENMRYSDKNISYKIENCPLQKKDDMERAFSILENKTILSFFPVVLNEQILVTCDSKAKSEGGLFIAGEGGPVNITQTENFNVIHKGKILLLKDSKCPRPNVALHELLHSLGFDHSQNPDNIMYNITKCRQTLGQDIIDFINEIYLSLSLPDLSFENVSSFKLGSYINLNFTLRNNGLADSGEAEVIIYADDKEIERVDVKALKIGQGRKIFLKNIFVLKRNFDELNLVINSEFEELNKENNNVKLKIKN